MATLSQYANENRVNEPTIILAIPTSGTTAPAPFDCFGTTPVGLAIPAVWTSTTLTFNVLPYIYNAANVPANADLLTATDTDGVAISIAVPIGGIYLPLHPIYFNGIRYINVTSSASQTNGAIIHLALAPLWTRKI